MRKIFLRGKYKDKFILVDDNDYLEISERKWYWTSKYPVTMVWDYKQKKQKMKKCHTFLINIPKGKVIDHVNRNTLDNRKSNLRICSWNENQQNKGISRNNKSGFKGVCLVSNSHKYNFTKKYRSVIQRDLIGYFKTVEEAALAYNREAIKRFGEFAVLNNI